MKKYMLGEICEINKGKVPITKAIKGDFPLVTTAEERSSHNEWHFDGDSILIPMVSSTGHGHASIKRIHFQTGKFAAGSILAVLSIKPDFDFSAKYLYAYLNFHKDEKLVSLMKGSANVSLTLDKLKQVEVEVPSREVQKKIEKFVEDLEELNSLLDDYETKIKILTKAGLQKLLKDEDK